MLGDWLVQGFCSTVVLWGLPSGPILGAIVAVWLQGDRGCKLGLSWMLVGPTLQPPGPRPSSRLGPRSSSSTSAWSDQHQQRQPTVGISSLEQALEVVTVAQQQQQRLECQGGRHLLLTLHLEGHGTSGPAMTISILDLAAGPAQQREQALKLLHEVATLHMRKCAGEGCASQELDQGWAGAYRRSMSPMSGPQSRAWPPPLALTLFSLLLLQETMSLPRPACPS